MAPPTVKSGAPPQAVAELDVERWREGSLSRERDLVAEELPVGLFYHGVPHGVMLATPADLEDFGIGFTLSEGLVDDAREIHDVEVVYGAETAEVRLSVAWERFSALLEQRRRLTGRTGCGRMKAFSAKAGSTFFSQSITSMSQSTSPLRSSGVSFQSSSSGTTWLPTRDWYMEKTSEAFWGS